MDNQSNGPDLTTHHHQDPTSSALQDSAFEPHSEFMFEVPIVDEEFRDMQRNIASLNVLANSQQDFPSSMSEVHPDSDVSGMSEPYSPDFVNPFIFDQQNFSPPSPSWFHCQESLGLPPHSTQAAIANDRNETVTHQFGQITPPNDEAPKDFTAVLPHATNASPLVQATQSVRSAKSERARNATSQRYAKAKKARKESAGKADGLDVEDEAVEGVEEFKRERYREKNRLAAARCRAKKKVNTEDLEESARRASARNSKLRAEERELRDLFSSLRDQALAHDQSQGCGCRAIHSYNLHKAQEAARGAMGLHRLMIPSPPQRTVDSASPSTGGASSRTQSFSGLRPEFTQHPDFSPSLAASLGYMAPGDGDMLQQPSSAGGDMGHSSGRHFKQSPIRRDDQNFSEYSQGSAECQR